MANVYLSTDALLRDYAILDQDKKNKAGRYIKNLLIIQRAENRLEREIRVLTGETCGNSSGLDIYCNFCGKRLKNVTRMFLGEDVYICNECVDLCSELLAEQDNSHEKTEHAEVGKAEK